MPKVIPDPTADTLDGLVYNRIRGQSFATLQGKYTALGSVSKGTINSTAQIDSVIDALCDTFFSVSVGAQQNVHVEASILEKKLIVQVEGPNRLLRAEVYDDRFVARFENAVRAVFTQAVPAGLLTAMGF